MNSWKRTVSRLLSGILVILGGLILLHPYWIPVVAKPLAARYNVDWAEIRTSGWTSYQLREVRFDKEKVTVQIDEMTLPQLLPLLRQRLEWGPLTRARASHVIIETRKGSGPDRKRKQGKGFALLDSIKASILDLQAWIPESGVEQLSIVGEDGSTHLILENLSMRKSGISGRLSGIRHVPQLDLELVLQPDQFRLTGQPAGGRDDLAMNLAIFPSLGKAQVKGDILSQGNPLGIELDFPPGRWTPKALRLKGEGWPIPSDLSQWTSWKDHALVAKVDFELVDRSYAAALHLTGETRLPGGGMEPVEAVIEFTGDRTYLKVAAFQLKTAWLEARLSDPVSFSLATKHFLKDGRFDLDADLDKQDFLPAKGKLKATAVVRTRGRNQPEMNLHVEGEAIEVFGHPIPKLMMEGAFDYPLLAFDSIHVDLGDDSSVDASGSYIMGKNEIDAKGQFSLSPDWLEPYAGQVQFPDLIRGEVTAKGPLSTVEHSGVLEKTKVSIPGLHPLSISGSWTRAMEQPMEVKSKVESAQGGRADWIFEVRENKPADAWEFLFKEGTLADGTHNLVLERPFTVRLSTGEGLRIDQLSPFRLGGGNCLLGGGFDRGTGIISVEAAGFDLGALESWSTRPKIPIEIDRMGIEISQIQPFMVADFSLAAHATNEEFEDLDVSLKGSTGSEGVRLERASGSMEGLTFIDGVFGLPILVHPVGRPTLVSPIPDQPVEGELTADISETLADKLPRIPYIGILPGMSARLTAEGTSESPVAGIDVSLEHLYPFKELDPSLDEYPLENVRLVARISPDLVELRTLEASVKDARLTATGTITMTSIIRLTGEETFRWEELLEENAFSARLENFQAGSFAGILPPYLRPTGSLDGRLEASPNAGVKGRLSLNDFSLRPTLYSPTVDGIHLDLEIDNRRMTLDKAGATVGNSEVGLTGYLDFKEWDNPTFKFNMTGERTPLLRTPDLLLHGDIDLDLDGSDPSMPPRLGGNIQLRDSVMLMDIDPMAARTSGQELPKPPFFNLTAPPFADWLLDVDISGEDFLRFRSPYVKALVSIQLNLTGTAANPVWIGDLSSTEGTIEFPGLRMTVSRSEIFITRERQDTVQLDLNAIGQVASYVVSLRVDETIDDPHVEFASTPDLNNTQILHLLATGSPERSGLSSVGLYLGRGLFDPGATNSVWDRFSIEIGRDVSESSKDTLDLYYDISEKWRIHGQYDKYDAQNINLEWEVFSR